MRDLLAGFAFVLIACTPLAAPAASDRAIDVQMLDATVSDSARHAMATGVLDPHFKPFEVPDAQRQSGTTFWLKLTPSEDFHPGGIATLLVMKGRHLRIEPFIASGSGTVPLRLATRLPGFRGAQQAVFVLHEGLTAGKPIYARVDVTGRGSQELRFTTSTLHEVLASAAEHARMIAISFGALMAMALAALLIWFILSERLLVLYATLFSLQALYMTYLSGQGFEWPVLSYALHAIGYSSNITAAFSGAVACLFVREIAELRRFSPRVYRIFGGFAATFVVLAFANFLDVFGLGGIVAAIGNLVFVASAVFTLVVAFMAWRRNNRAAGWFLIAWGLLEAFTIATAVRLLMTRPEGAEGLLYYGLPLSMVAAAVLIALGVADRLRDQRAALGDAERRAQTDPLTGVLNRRSLLERLEAACLRARARGLPIALLFIDLDHFKDINDSYGHAAGDACLRAIIGPIQAELRQSDVIGRYGGEEFVVMLSSADAAAAQPIAERICRRVAEIRVEGFGKPISLTCSIGVATSDTLGLWDEHLIAQADAAVYTAKRSGRNRIHVAVPLAA